MDPILPFSYSPISCIPPFIKASRNYCPHWLSLISCFYSLLKPSPFVPIRLPCEDVKELAGYTSLGVKSEADEIHLGVSIKEVAMSTMRTDGATQTAGSRLWVLPCLPSRGRGTRPSILREQLMRWEEKQCGFLEAEGKSCLRRSRFWPGSHTAERSRRVKTQPLI